MKMPAPFLKRTALERAKEVRIAGIGLIRQKNKKNTQKILEMHEKFGYNVTILYSVKYSEL